MSVEYQICVIHEDRADWQRALESALDEELRALGVHRTVGFRVSRAPPPAGEPGVAVYLGSEAGTTSDACGSLINAARAARLVVVPVLEGGRPVSGQTPPALRSVNAWWWEEPGAAARLARLLFEELGVEDRQRRVFISHRREDALLMAEQLHDSLAHSHFVPFVDRFHIAAGEEVQQRIEETLEDFAFLLLVESPRAHESDWVFFELEYALAHHMGIHIVRWPGNFPPIPGSQRLPRQQLEPGDLTTDNGYQVLADGALEQVCQEVEEAHAYALVRRRRNLLVSVEESARARSLTAIPQPRNEILIAAPGRAWLVRVTPRLPRVEDLYEVDSAREELAASLEQGQIEGVLVHGARLLPDRLRHLLEWSIGTRSLTLVPENAVGAYWSR